MTPPLGPRLGALVLTFVLPLAAQAPASTKSPDKVPTKAPDTAPDKAAWLARARAAYYSLEQERMDQVQCRIVPNWRLLLQEMKVEGPAAETAAQRLGAITFSLTLNRQGQARLTHTTITADSDQMAEGLKQIYTGCEQMVTGFFETWSAFVVRPPLPAPGTPFQLEEQGLWWVVRFEEADGAKVEVVLGKDYAASSVKVVAKTFQSTLNPRFTKGPKGLLMSGYQAVYRSGSAQEDTDLTVALDPQTVDGLQFPARMDLRGSYGTTPFHVEVRFADARATRY